MRLIDADKLKACIIATCDGQILKRAEFLWDVINKIPTAYDANKIINELEQDKFCDCETILSDTHQGYNAGLCRAIEIVKGGGVNE